MKFIFPQNYNFNDKLLGFIDYSTLVLNILWGLFVYFLISLFTFTFMVKLFIFIILFLPFFLLTIIGFNHERIIYIIKYVFLFLISPKIYLFKKF